MAAPHIIPLPPGVTLWDSCVLRVAAIDPTTGDIVSGVTVSDVTIECEDLRPGTLKADTPILIGVSA